MGRDNSAHLLFLVINTEVHRGQCGEIGRRSGLKDRRRKSCGFKSLHFLQPLQKETMAHGEWLSVPGKQVRDAILDAHDAGMPLRKAIAIALENLNFGQMEAGSIESLLKEESKKYAG